MAGRRPPIKSGVLRAVRQRCGFGCVVCGLPLYEYDHLLGWANTKRHVAGEITLLCDKHHSEKGKGLLPLSEVFKANENPFNLREGASTPYTLHYGGEPFEIEVGSNTLCQESALGDGQAVTAVCIDDVPLLGFQKKGEELSLVVQLFTPSNEMILQVVDNEMVYSTGTWDIEFVGQRLTIREAARRILVSVRFEPPGRVVIERGQFTLNGIHIEVFKDRAIIRNKNAVLKKCSATGFPIGLGAGDLPEGLSAAFYSGELKRNPIPPVSGESQESDGTESENARWKPDVLRCGRV